MLIEIELFECPDLNTLDICVCVCVCVCARAVGCTAKFQKESPIYETNCWHVFWMLLPAKSNEMKSNEQHAIFAHVLKSALRLAVGFSNVIVNCNRFVIETLNPNSNYNN